MRRLAGSMGCMRMASRESYQHYVAINLNRRKGNWLQKAWAACSENLC